MWCVAGCHYLSHLQDGRTLMHTSLTPAFWVGPTSDMVSFCKCTAVLLLGEMRDDLVWVRILSLLLAVSIKPSLGLKLHVHPPSVWSL